MTDDLNLLLAGLRFAAQGVPGCEPTRELCAEALEEIIRLHQFHASPLEQLRRTEAQLAAYEEEAHFSDHWDEADWLAVVQVLALVRRHLGKLELEDPSDDERTDLARRLADIDGLEPSTVREAHFTQPDDADAIRAALDETYLHYPDARPTAEEIAEMLDRLEGRAVASDADVEGD